jgi:2,3,4,5-tetrahydropyridine-2,6-dicarboxylate N-succinyltransferase
MYSIFDFPCSLIAVVVAGSRPIKNKFAEQHGLSIYTPLIIKYRDEKTDKAVSLEDLLRS